ncbi:hypothetical protein H0H93_012450, partial [Arthromyces matolae]
AVVASPTFSLPEFIGGTRNWDYRASWIRDSSFTLYALIRLGFTQEANGTYPPPFPKHIPTNPPPPLPHPTTAYLEFIFERLRNKNPDGSLQIMYTIHGALPFCSLRKDFSTYCPYSSSSSFLSPSPPLSPSSASASSASASSQPPPSPRPRPRPRPPPSASASASVDDDPGGKDLEEIELTHLDGHKGSKPVRIGNGAADHVQLDGLYLPGPKGSVPPPSNTHTQNLLLLLKFGKPISYDDWVLVRE